MAAAEAEAPDPRRALVRKVAQLTKVLAHLAARGDGAELRCEALRVGGEDRVQTVALESQDLFRGPFLGDFFGPPLRGLLIMSLYVLT